MANNLNITITTQEVGQRLSGLVQNFNALGRTSADALNAANARAVALTGTFSRLGQNINLTPALRREAQVFAQVSTRIQGELANIQRRLATETNRTVITALESQAQRAQARLAALNREAQNLRNTAALSPAAPAGSGIFGGAGQLAGALGLGLSVAGAVQFGREAVQAFARAESGLRVLNSTSRETRLSFEYLTKQATEFGRLTAQSNADAARSFSSVARFANLAGRPNQTEDLAKSLADLTAARGFDSSRIPDFISQLVTGQDEVFDRLLSGGNPSTYYEKYARSIGKTAAQLSDLEKAQVRLNAVIQEGALFNGEAERRLETTSGKLEQLGANFQNLLAKIGKPIAEIGNNVFSVSGGLGRFAENFTLGKNPGTQLREAFDAQQKERIEKNAEAIRQSVESNNQANFDLLKEFENAQNRTGANRNVEDLALQLAKNRKLQVADLNDPKKQREITFDAIPKLVGDPAQQLADNKAILAVTRKEAETYVGNLKKNLTSALESADLKTLRLAQKEFYTNQGLFDSDTNRSLAVNLEKAITENVKAATEKVKELGKNAQSFFRDLNLQANSNNAFVSIFEAARANLQKTREETRLLSKELQEAALKSTQIINARQLVEARFDSRLGSLDLRQQARSFRAGDSNLLSPETRLREQLAAIDDELRKSVGADSRRLGGSFASGRGGLFQLTNGIEPQLNAEQKARLAQFQSLADKRIINATAGFKPEDLSFDLRERAAEAREREAVRLDNQEREALANSAAQLEETRKLNAKMDEFIKIAKEQGLSGIQIAIEDKSGLEIEMQQTPTPNRLN